MNFETAVHIASPRGLAYRVLADVESYTEWLPGCDAVEASDLDDGVIEAKIVLTRPHRVTLRLRFELTAGEKVSFRMLGGGAGLREFSGSWRTGELRNGGSLVRGCIGVRPAWGIPAVLLRGPVRSWLEDSARALRDRVAEKTEAGVEPYRRGGSSGRGRRLLYVGRGDDGRYRVWVSPELGQLPSDMLSTSPISISRDTGPR